ncbi:MAG TPA: stage II sporulation protein M [Saprospiraceae bacterium]|nr:stage II sporulation protein M [Saprospiraceae bacterium]
MKETKFIEQNREKWAEFEKMLREDRKDPEKLNDLFIQVTDDLSYARTFYPNRSVRVFLNSLAQRVFHNIYRGRRFPAERLRLFWTDELPRIMWESRQALLLSFTLFVLSFTIGVVSSILNPDFARVILGDGYVDMTLTNIENGDPMAVYKDSGPLGMTAGITANNMFVALRTAIFGVLASIGTVFIMLYNGIMVGAFQYFFVEQGVFWESFLTIWIHGTLEISAIIIAGASGLVAGSGLLFPGTYRRVQAFQLSMRRGLKIFIGIVPIIVLAGFFESFLTRFTETPDPIRAAFIGTSLLFVLWYFVWLPWQKHRSGAFKPIPVDKELPPTREHAVDFFSIKTVGEILSDVFTVLSRHPRTTLLGLFATTAAFAGWAFGWSDKPAADTFLFPDQYYWPLDILGGLGDFFSMEHPGGLYFFQIILLAGIAVAAFRALEQEMEPEMRRDFSPKKALLAGLPLLLLMPGFAAALELLSEFFGVMVSWIVFPFLALWSAVVYFETPNPFKALIRTFQLIRWGPALGMGLLAGSLNLLFFMFLESPIWEMTLELFSWLVPPAEGAMAAFSTISTTCAAGVLMYFFFLVTILSGGLQYFAFREIGDAASLRKQLEQLGQTRKIRGLARE